MIGGTAPRISLKDSVAESIIAWMAAVTERILCVDDDEQIRRLVMRVVSSAGHDCSSASDATEARARLSEEEYAVVLCDIELPRRVGARPARRAEPPQPGRRHRHGHRPRPAVHRGRGARARRLRVLDEAVRRQRPAHRPRQRPPQAPARDRTARARGSPAGNRRPAHGRATRDGPHAGRIGARASPRLPGDRRPARPGDRLPRPVDRSPRRARRGLCDRDRVRARFRRGARGAPPPGEPSARHREDRCPRAVAAEAGITHARRAP